LAKGGVKDARPAAGETPNRSKASVVQHD